MEIDLSPVIAPLFEVAGAAVTLLASWVLFQARGFIKEKQQKELRAKIQEAIRYGIAYGVAKIEKEKPSINVKESITSHAVQYVIDRVPQALKSMDINMESLSRMIEARLGLIDVYEVSPEETKITGVHTGVSARSIL